jgi:hypothetical protein
MAGHGSPPASDRGSDPNRQVGRPVNGGIFTNRFGTTVLPPKPRIGPPASGVNGPSSQYNPDASPGVNAMAAAADESVRRRRMRFGS